MLQSTTANLRVPLSIAIALGNLTIASILLEADRQPVGANIEIDDRGEVVPIYASL